MHRFVLSLLLLVSLVLPAGVIVAQAPLNADPPSSLVRLVFIHHSTGGNWLADPNNDQPYGGLGRALMENNYFVSATNYGWGPNAIGDRTDIPNWPEWFVGPERDLYMQALYTESGQNFGDFGSWPRPAQEPAGENVIILLKSCFPNSDLYGSPNDSPLEVPNDEYSVANAKAVYQALLGYFESRQDRLFIVITAPPLRAEETSPDRAANARALNDWLVNDWLAVYPYSNVAVFDYYHVLTGAGNHHQWNGQAVEHVQGPPSNTSAYPSGDSHPSSVGDQKATAEFVPLLNYYYHRWQAGGAAERPPVATEEAATAVPVSTPAEPQGGAAGGGSGGGTILGEWHADAGDGGTVTCELDSRVAHGSGPSLRMQYGLSTGWGNCAQYYNGPQNWQSGEGLSFWVQADPPGKIILTIFFGDAENAMPFDVQFEAGQDWRQISIPWSDFKRAEWADPNGPEAVDPGRITGLAVSGDTGKGTVWIDDLALISSTLVEEPPVVPPVTPAAGGGGCVPAALALPALGLWISGRRKDK